MRTLAETKPGKQSAFNLLRTTAVVVAALLATSCARLQDFRDENPGIRMDQLRVAPGHTVSLFAKDLPKARQMAFGDTGNLFVGSSAGKVYLVRLDGARALSQKIILDGLKDPQGIAFFGGSLYVADRTRILRYAQIEQRLDNPPAPTVVIDGLPDKSRHGAHVMRIGPDKKLYIAVGSPCDVCKPEGDEFGVILRVNADGSGKEVVARGIRNSVGYDWDPVSGDLFFTDNGQDALGNDQPNDELNRVKRTGEHFGFPYCHDRAIADPEFGRERACTEFSAPVFGLGPHVAALGMRFYDPLGKRTADAQSILVARHGSHPPTRVGYDVVSVGMKDGAPTVMQPFLTGFLQGMSYWGRPTDVALLPDNSVLISDDLNGAIYRVTPTR